MEELLHQNKITEELIDAQIKLLGQITPQIKHFRVTPKKTPFYFKPGQWVDVYVPISGKNLTGYTVISSYQNTDFFELAIRRSDEHPVTHYMHNKIIDSADIKISKAQGRFFLPAELHTNKINFIAGGIGITPILSMMRSLPKNNYKLFYSVSKKSEILFPEELTSRGVLTATQEEGPDWRGERGRIDLEFLKRHGAEFTSPFFICGPPAMIDNIKSQLMAFGVQPKNIHHEKWW